MKTDIEVLTRQLAELNEKVQNFEMRIVAHRLAFDARILVLESQLSKLADHPQEGQPHSG